MGSDQSPALARSLETPLPLQPLASLAPWLDDNYASPLTGLSHLAQTDGFSYNAPLNKPHSGSAAFNGSPLPTEESPNCKAYSRLFPLGLSRLISYNTPLPTLFLCPKGH